MVVKVEDDIKPDAIKELDIPEAREDQFFYIYLTICHIISINGAFSLDSVV